MLLEEAYKLFEVKLAVFAVEVENESGGSETKELYFSGLAVQLEILNECVLCADLVVELEVIDHSLAAVFAHFLVVVGTLEEDPFKAGEALAFRYLPPPFPSFQQLPHQLLVVVLPRNQKRYLLADF